MNSSRVAVTSGPTMCKITAASWIAGATLWLTAIVLLLMIQ